MNNVSITEITPLLGSIYFWDNNFLHYFQDNNFTNNL